MTEKKKGGRLEGWHFDENNNVLWGNLYDDPQDRFPQGTYVHTSYIVTLDVDNKIVETRNSIYELGDKHDYPANH